MNAPPWGENIEDVGHNGLNPTNDHEGFLACYEDLWKFSFHGCVILEIFLQCQKNALQTDL